MRSNVHPVEPEELMAYLDGELPLDRAADTAAHLQECRECQILAAEMKSLSEGLAVWEVSAAEPAINDELSKALEERGQQQASASGRWHWFGGGSFRRAVPWANGAVTGGVAVLLVMFALIFSFSRVGQRPMAVAGRTERSAGAIESR